MVALTERSAHRAIISYCVNRGMAPIQTLREMGKTKEVSSVSRTLVYTWHKCFKTESDLTTAEKRGRPKKNQAAQMKKIKRRSGRRRTSNCVEDCQKR